MLQNKPYHWQTGTWWSQTKENASLQSAAAPEGAQFDMPALDIVFPVPFYNMSQRAASKFHAFKDADMNNRDRD